MIGLFFSQVILYAVAAVIGFAIGWRLRAQAAALNTRAANHDVEALRAALQEASVRRARAP